MLPRFAPGLASLLPYDRGKLRYDLIAGVSVAAVALPVGVAYAELARFAPAAGLYPSILPLVAYAIFGTSRHLIIGPDATTCALLAAAVTPLARCDQKLYESLSVTLALMAGVLCIGASFLKLECTGAHKNPPRAPRKSATETERGRKCIDEESQIQGGPQENRPSSTAFLCRRQSSRSLSFLFVIGVM
jgi:hypothetical protein